MKKLFAAGIIVSACVYAAPPNALVTDQERQQLYLKTLQKMRSVAPPRHRIDGTVSRIRLDSGRAESQGGLRPFWRTQVLPDRWLAANESWLLSRRDPVFDLLEKETGRSYGDGPKSMMLGDTVSAVRLLGGWNPAWKGGEVLPDTPVQDYDLVYRDEYGGLQYRWDLLHKRVGPIVTNGFTPFFVLDNIPYCFAAWDGNSGYGQNLAPADFEEWGVFVEELCRELVRSYGFDKANRWRFRIGTEMDNPHHWENGAPDSLEKYLKTYDFATAAVRKILPGAKVGACNFNSMFAGQLNRVVPPMAVFEHFAGGTNYATGEIGSPVDFIAVSSYGMYWMGGVFDHPDAAAHGYSPDVLRVHADFLKRLRALSPRFAGIPVEIQEHGTLFNKEEVSSPEPGSFGGAWTASQYITGMEEGVSQVFHWAEFDRVAGKILLYSHAWVRVMFEKMVGGEMWVPAVETAADDAFLNLLAVRKDNSLYLLLSCYSPERADRPDEAVQISLPAVVTGKAIRRLQLSFATSPFDQIARDLDEAGEFTGSVGSIPAMMTPAGRAIVAANAPKYIAMQDDSLAWTSCDEVLKKPGVIEMNIPVPSVTLLEVRLDD
jgi:hypothetical protein